jgi:flagella basal body P-ring formation protein FlgA
VLLIFVAAFVAQNGSLEMEIGAQVRAVLPADLVLTKVIVPAHLADKEWSSVNAELRTAPRAGDASIAVALVGASGEHVSTWARIKVARDVPMVVAMRPLQAGAKLDYGDLSQPVFIGATLERDIAAGAKIERADVILAPPLPRGKVLRVLSRFGGIEIAAPGTLERPARIGEPASARVSGALKIVRGRLHDADTLIIDGSKP